MRFIPILLASLLAGAVAEGATTPDTGIAMDIPTQQVNRAIDRAMHWLGEHPARATDDELMEVVEEIMFFYALHASPARAAERPYYRREIAARDRAIKAYLAESTAARHHLEGDWAALTYPPLVHILAGLGLETGVYRGLIDELMALKRHLTPPRSAMRLWIAIYLARLDLVQEASVLYLLNDSSLQQDPETHALLDYFTDAAAASRQPQATIQLIYNITHEIIALSDFGALPPPPVMLAQRAHHARLLDAAIGWATRASALDVLAELVFCAHLLDMNELPALPAAVALIMGRQQADGAFGITNPDRPNGVRHGVLTSLLALMTLDTEQQTVDMR